MASSPASDRRPTFYHWMLRKLLPRIPFPLRISLWNGDEMNTAPGEPIAHVRIRDRGALLRLLFTPDLGFGDAYTTGRIELEGDIVLFLEEMFRARMTARRGGFLRQWLARGWSRPRTNSQERSRENVHHYNLGNEFYRLWLDEQLVYTCAYFPDPTMTLEQAQVAKMDHVCRKLQLQPGETVVEAGCGWGALALHMARHYGVKVTAYNLSREQVAFAQERAKAEGVDGRVQYVQDDYRKISGQYDVFVSVGMLEHVGPAHYRELGSVIQRSMKPTGRGLIHSIGRNHPGPTNPWLDKRIFPGAYMPSLREMMNIFEPWQLSVLDVENLRLHYAKTLEHWLERFERVASQVGEMFDQCFVRAWRLYLAASLAGFTSGVFQLFQVVFTHATKNDIPWTRGRVYDHERRSFS
jgi:cyclopropane-fatty-acyl-phospholipid synthase